MTTMRRDARLSTCERYRYTLTRDWDVSRTACVFIGLNPSTADAQVDDPTIRRCIGFARAWGYGAFIMLNLFAWRATRPADMLAADDPVGPLNDDIIRETCRGRYVVACWGAHGHHAKRDDRVMALLRGIGIVPAALGLTAAGQPRHPLYLRRDCLPVPYERPAPAEEGKDHA